MWRLVLLFISSVLIGGIHQAPPEDLLIIFNGFENIEDLLVPYAKKTILGRVVETTLVWNQLGSQLSTQDVSFEVKKQWLIQGEVDPRQWNLYAASQSNKFDMTLVNSYYSYANYLITGRKTEIWAIPLGSCKYIPSLSSYSAPYGDEYGISNLIKANRRLYSFYFKKGENSYGGGLAIASLMRFKRADFDFVGDVWQQPHLTGGRLGVKFIFNFLENDMLQIETGGGFKTAGYLPGHANRAGGDIYLGSQFAY